MPSWEDRPGRSRDVATLFLGHLSKNEQSPTLFITPMAGGSRWSWAMCSLGGQGVLSVFCATGESSRPQQKLGCSTFHQSPEPEIHLRPGNFVAGRRLGVMSHGGKLRGFVKGTMWGSCYKRQMIRKSKSPVWTCAGNSYRSESRQSTKCAFVDELVRIV